jgi:hypothetical protein
MLDDAGDGFVLSDKYHHKVDGFACAGYLTHPFEFLTNGDAR